MAGRGRAATSRPPEPPRPLLPSLVTSDPLSALVPMTVSGASGVEGTGTGELLRGMLVGGVVLCCCICIGEAWARGRVVTGVDMGMDGVGTWR